MTARLIDGKALAQNVRQYVKEKTIQFKTSYGYTPGIAVLRVGEDLASQVYVRAKENIAREIGFLSRHQHFPDSITQEELVTLVKQLNTDTCIHGILIQLPLPKHIDATAVIEAIHPHKDVDCFHPENAGRLFQGKPTFMPCTPAGVMKILESISYNLTGKNCLIVGRSNIVGRPMAMLLLNAHATVTICHSKSEVEAEVRRADVVIAATGVPHLIQGTWVKPEAVVIDVGIHREADGKLIGDVEFDTAKQRAKWITPVPGGVGPMTIAMLMQNTLLAAQLLTA